MFQNLYDNSVRVTASYRLIDISISFHYHSTEREVLGESESVPAGSASHFEQLGSRGIQPHSRHLLQNHVGQRRQLRLESPISTEVRRY